MRSELGFLFIILVGIPQVGPKPNAQYRLALPGYRYEFPRDYFNHPDFQTEWWYYTGNLHSADGHRFGFELTFFRVGVHRPTPNDSAWALHDLYLAHLAMSDLDGGQFYQNERTNRAGPGIAGANETQHLVWNGNWRIQWRGDEQDLQAIDERFALRFTLHTAKSPVIQGENGVSQKGDGPGRASHYISLTRLITGGQIELGLLKYDVTGTTWMDHEFFTSQLSADQVGWDWLSIQLQDNTELMLFDIRRKDGSIDRHSSGTFVEPSGQNLHLNEQDFSLEPGGTKWTSPVTGAVYPLHWKVSIPKLSIDLEVTTRLANQELTSKSKLIPAYWEGAIQVTGRKGIKSIGGVGYLEMTGYDRPLSADSAGRSGL
jgi:predicted secreted hydrolase